MQRKIRPSRRLNPRRASALADMRERAARIAALPLVNPLPLARASTATTVDAETMFKEDTNNNEPAALRGAAPRPPSVTPTNDASAAVTPSRQDSVRVLLGLGGDRKPLLDRSVSSRSTRSRCRVGTAGRKLRRRVVLKSGEVNVCQTNISQRRLRYLQDIFTTLVDTQWRWTLLVFALSFILSWLGFATLWWLIAFTHGDLAPAETDNPCVVNLRDFASCFLFSIETQHTIGYGSRSTTEECPEAIFVMCLQSITGVMIQAFMVGIVFAKMSRPKQRTQTLLFSRNAVVCQRDGSLCLMFRVGDMRKSHIIGAQVRAQLIRTRQTPEGETLSQSQCELEVGTDEGTSELFFIWPVTVVHRITPSSPLYRTSASDLVDRDRGDRFELVVILEGTIESTGQTTQARSSYLPTEIMWGHRFEPVVSYNKDRQAYEVNYAKFNITYEVATPLLSALELEDFYRAQRGPPSGALTLQRSMNSSPHLQDASIYPHYATAHLFDVTEAELLYLDTVSYSSAHESDDCSEVSIAFQRNGTQTKYKRPVKVSKTTKKKPTAFSEDESLPSSSPKTLAPVYSPIVSNGSELEGARHSGRYSPQWQGNNYSAFTSPKEHKKKLKNDTQNSCRVVDDTYIFSVLGTDTQESNL